MLWAKQCVGMAVWEKLGALQHLTGQLPGLLDGNGFPLACLGDWKRLLKPLLLSSSCCEGLCVCWGATTDVSISSLTILGFTFLL